MKSPIAVVVLAAGAGTRMKSALPKVLHPLAGWPMVRHVLENARRLKPARIVGVVAPGARDVAAAFAPHPTVVQRKPLGTGHATKAALPALEGHRGPVLVVYADAPLITTATLQRLVEACRKAKAAVGVLGFVASDPSPYGRLIVRDGMLERIVESRDADAAEKAIDFCNSGVMCLDGALIGALLGAIRNDNVKSEFYLTDAVAVGPRRRPRRDRRRRRRGGVPGHQFARRAGGGGEGPAAAPARGCVRGGRQHGRSRHGLAGRRHEVRAPTSRSAPTCASASA